MLCDSFYGVHKVYEALNRADVLILASPMYWWNLAAPLKAVVDRFFALPFYASKEASAFAGKKLVLVMTTGQPSEHDGHEGLEMILQRMCTFTGMNYGGSVRAGTNATPVAQQQDLCEKAYAFGRSL